MQILYDTVLKAVGDNSKKGTSHPATIRGLCLSKSVEKGSLFQPTKGSCTQSAAGLLYT